MRVFKNMSSSSPPQTLLDFCDLKLTVFATTKFNFVKKIL